MVQCPYIVGRKQCVLRIGHKGPCEIDTYWAPGWVRCCRCGKRMHESVTCDSELNPICDSCYEDDA